MTTEVPAIDRETALPPAEQIWLRRSGARPLRFHGWLLLEGSDREPGSGWWHEVQIYETASAGFAVSIGALFPQGQQPEFWRAWLVESADAAARLLWAFDPVADLPVRVDLLDPRLSQVALDTTCREIDEEVQRTRAAFQRMLAAMLPPSATPLSHP